MTKICYNSQCACFNQGFPEMLKECPVCHTPFGTSSPNAFNLNLGDANAISGGVNMSDNHSVSNNTVNTSNVDSHNVITNHITQIEREKTAEELKHERELAYREECLKAYRNGIMTSEEKRKLEDLQYRLGLDESSASKILSEVAKRSERKSTTLSPVHQITFNNIKTAINGNRLDLVKRLMAQMKAMVQRYSVEEIQFTYYMLTAILNPKESVEEYQSHREDKYWQTFWASIAYRRLGNIEQSELLVADVGDKWIDTIPQENVFILATINALIDKDVPTAKFLYDNIVGEHSPYLSNIATCLYTLLYNDVLTPEELTQMQKDSKFYIENLFADVVAQVAEKKKMQVEETNAKRIAEEKRKEVQGQNHAEKKLMKEETEQICPVEEPKTKDATDLPSPFNPEQLTAYLDGFGYLRTLSEDEILQLKPMLEAAPTDNYQAQFVLGQLYLQDSNTAVNQKKAYDALITASEHGVYEAAAFMAYFYLYGKVVAKDLDEAEQRMKIDDDYKKNPLFIKMLIDLYTDKGNEMLANVWKSKLKKMQ